MLYCSSIKQPGQPVTCEGRQLTPMGAYLAFKELWRSKGRYLLVSLVVALITTLVLFIAGLAEGLGAGNIEYLQKLDAQLLLYQKDAEISIPASRLDWTLLNDVERVSGVVAVGPISFDRTSIVLKAGHMLPGGSDRLDVSMIGVELGKPGEPPVLTGQQLRNRRGKDAIIDQNVARQAHLAAGDSFQIKSLQGTKEETYTLRVVGVTDSRQYSIQPSIIVPFLTADEVRPKATVVNNPRSDLIANIFAVRVDQPANPDSAAAYQQMMIKGLESQVRDVQAVTVKTGYENTPGYSAQQGTLNTQRYFALIIGVLVLGGFFQIQALQKVPQIGVLKAIGAPNGVIAATLVLQTVVVTAVGVAIGGAGSLALAAALPPGIPITFSAQSVSAALVSLLLIGPLGGLVSVRYSITVEPLTALGLSA